MIALDNLIDDGKVAASGKYLIKLDVEGVEIEAIKGGTRLLQADSVILCEEHGSDRTHAVSRYILDHTPLHAVRLRPGSRRLEAVTELSMPRPHQGLDQRRLQRIRHRKRVLARPDRRAERDCHAPPAMRD